jgi:Zn-dependent protease with chaperone function
MSSARRLYRFQVAFAVTGTAGLVLASAVVARAVTMKVPSVEALLSACMGFVLPTLTSASVAVLALGALTFAGAGLAGRSLLRQLRAHHHLSRGLKPLTYPEPGPRRAIVFEGSRPQAFCAGLLRPRVFVSRGAVAALTPDQLDAVLAHEMHHVRRRDPLRLLVARVLADALFFLPVLRRAVDRYGALAEVAADEAALRRTGDRRAPLAAALLAFEAPAARPAVSIAPERVDHLTGQPPRWNLPVAQVAWGAVVLLGLFSAAVWAAQVTAGVSLSLPLMAAQLCMAVMALAPALVSAAALLLGWRRLRR